MIYFYYNREEDRDTLAPNPYITTVPPDETDEYSTECEWMFIFRVTETVFEQMDGTGNWCSVDLNEAIKMMDGANEWCTSSNKTHKTHHPFKF